MAEFFHALGFHMHQPPDNLELLWREHEWEARQIMLCYRRPLTYARRFADQGRFHVDFSGILLEQLCDKALQRLYRETLDVEEMLAGYAAADNIELLATGYFHPIFPLIPPADWGEQLARSTALMQRVFGRRPRGFWPPEMAFSMEMVPALAEAGFEYVVVDHVHVFPEGHQGAEETATHPYLAEHDGARIAVIPRHRDLSNAQESGMAPEWLAEQVIRRAQEVSRPALFTTWSDGENGGWFRQTAEEAGFWGHFYAPYMERVQAGGSPLSPVLISEYLRQHPPQHRARVRTGAWNVGHTDGLDFSQWSGTPGQKAALARLWRTSEEQRRLQARLKAGGEPAAGELLARAREMILRAGDLLLLLLGRDLDPRALALLEEADRALARARELLEKGGRQP